jgi:para-nitrobenzyl esterase
MTMVPAIMLAVAVTALPQTTTRAVTDLAGEPWRLVRFQGGDGTTLRPDDPAKYTIQFNADGSLNARLDCNRGRGTWKSAVANQIELGPLALTRMLCPPGSLHDQIVKQWEFVRSYVMRDGRLVLSLMADGGTFEFERAGAPLPAARAAVTWSGAELECTRD